MLALVKYGKGPHETELRDVPVPEIGDEDVLIRVKSAGVCGADIAWDNGEMAFLLNCPVVLGHEFAGIIAKVGSKVTDWKIGDRVVSDNTAYICGKCDACITGDSALCKERKGLGFSMDGGFTDYVRVPGEAIRMVKSTLIHLPDNVSFEEAALLDPFTSAYRAMNQDSNPIAGEDVVVMGVGPQGLMSVALANLKGCGRIIAVGLSSDAKRLELAKQVGATHTFMSDKDDVYAEIAKLTDGDMVPLIIDATGSNKAFPLICSICREKGEIVRIGYDPNPLNVSLDDIVNRSLKIKGHRGADSTCYFNSIKLMGLGKLDLKPFISHRMELKDWEKAFDLMRKREATKIVFNWE